MVTEASQYIPLSVATERLQELLAWPTLTRRTVSRWIRDKKLRARKTHVSRSGRVMVLRIDVENFPRKMLVTN